MRLIGQICNRLQRASGRFGFGTASVRQLGRGVNVCATGVKQGREIERALEKERESDGWIERGREDAENWGR